jgi:ferritin-like metal-binding protein YciE
MKIETLDDLFYEELRELYDEEQRLVDVLPKMAKNALSPQLRAAFEQHLQETRTHVTRLEECFRDLGKRADTETASGLKGLVQEGEHLMGNIEESPLRDAALISAAKKVELYENSAYTDAVTFAHLLGRKNCARLLEQTRHEEEQAAAKLTRIGEESVNREALMIGAHHSR